jgi:DNA repair exonuclease SbcCD ATPase subunit
LTLIPELQDMVNDKELNSTIAYKIWAKLNPDQQKEMFDKIGKDTITELTQKATSELLKQLEQERKEKEKLIELNTDLLTREYEIEQLQEKIKEMEQDLEDRPVIEKITNVEPPDYQSVKTQLSATNKDYNRLNNDYKNKVEEINSLKKQIESLQCTSEEEQYTKKLKDGAIFFCNRVNDFIEKTGGFVWLSDNIMELPEYERKSYIKAIEMVENWAFAMKANMKNYL